MTLSLYLKFCKVIYLYCKTINYANLSKLDQFKLIFIIMSNILTVHYSQGMVQRRRQPRSNLEEQQLRKLMYSVTQNDFDQVDKLVTLGIPNLINMLDMITRETALHAAVCNGLDEMVSFLLEHGSNINKRDKLGRTPLIRAVDKGNKKILELLLEAGGNPNDQDPSKQHVLFYGLQPTSRHLACIELLLKEGADINTQDKNGQTMLIHTVQHGYIDLSETLIQLGADVNIQNVAGESLIFTAAKQDHAKLIPILMKAKAPKNDQDLEGNTTIHLCASNKKMEMMKLLAGFGVELDIQNLEGDTPFHIAVRESQQDVIKYFLARGVQIDITNGEGLTLKQIAQSHKDNPVKKLLKKQESKIKKSISDGKVTNHSEFWKMCLYVWCKEHKNTILEEFFAKDTNQTGLLERKIFCTIWEEFEVPLTDRQKDEIIQMHRDTNNLIKYLDFLDANLYLKTASYEGFARA